MTTQPDQAKEEAEKSPMRYILRAYHKGQEAAIAKRMPQPPQGPKDVRQAYLRGYNEVTVKW